MKFLFFLLIALQSTYASVNLNEFLLKEESGDYYLYKDTKKIAQVNYYGVKPELKKIVNPNKGYYLLVYYAGSAGTTSPVFIEEAVVFNKDHKMIKVIPYSAINKDKELVSIKYKKNSIEVYEDGELTTSVKLP